MRVVAKMNWTNGGSFCFNLLRNDKCASKNEKGVRNRMVYRSHLSPPKCQECIYVLSWLLKICGDSNINVCESGGAPASCPDGWQEGDRKRWGMDARDGGWGRELESGRERWPWAGIAFALAMTAAWCHAPSTGETQQNVLQFIITYSSTLQFIFGMLLKRGGNVTWEAREKIAVWITEKSRDRESSGWEERERKRGRGRDRKVGREGEIDRGW